MRCCLLEDHVVVGVVEGVSAHHPHQAGVHQGPMGRPAQRLSRRLDARQHPEGLGGGDGQRAVGTWGNIENALTRSLGWGGLRDRTCSRRRKAYAFLALNTCCYGNQPFFYPTVCALDECCEAVWPSPPDSLLHRHTPLCVTDVFVLFYGSLRTFMNKHTFRPPFFWTIHASQEWYKSHKEIRFYVGK